MKGHELLKIGNTKIGSKYPLKYMKTQSCLLIIYNKTSLIISLCCFKRKYSKIAN